MPARADGVNLRVPPAYALVVHCGQITVGIRVVSMSSICRWRRRQEEVRDLPDLLQNKSALEGDVERRASLCADVVHRNARMQFNENEAAALFHLEHA